MLKPGYYLWLNDGKELTATQLRAAAAAVSKASNGYAEDDESDDHDDHDAMINANADGDQAEENDEAQ